MGTIKVARYYWLSEDGSVAFADGSSYTPDPRDLGPNGQRPAWFLPSRECDSIPKNAVVFDHEPTMEQVRAALEAKNGGQNQSR